jgi:hypothetical protein
MRREALANHTLLKFWVQHRKGKLNTPKKIPIHPVRRGEIDILLARIIKIKYAAVL